MFQDKLKRFYNKAPVTSILLGIMVAYFVFMSLNGGTTNSQSLIKHGAMFPPMVLALNQYYRFVTSIFIHIGFLHLVFNGYALAIFGSQIERLIGAKKYLGFFLLTGIGGNLLTFFFSFNTVSAGASGSLFGLLGAFVYLIHKHPQMLTPEGRRGILKLLGINLLMTIAVPSISVTAHFGGLIFGYLLSYIFLKPPKRKLPPGVDDFH